MGGPSLARGHCGPLEPSTAALAGGRHLGLGLGRHRGGQDPGQLCPGKAGPEAVVGRWGQVSWFQLVSTTPTLSQVNESWTLSDCTVALCEGHNRVVLLGRKPVASIHCVNGHPPVRVSQESEPCDFHFECECKQGRGEGRPLRAEGIGGHAGSQGRSTQCRPERVTRRHSRGRPRFAEPTRTAASVAGRGPGVRGLLSQGFLSVPPGASCGERFWPGPWMVWASGSGRKRVPHTGVKTSAMTNSFSPEAAGRALPAFSALGAPGVQDLWL